MHCSPCNTSLTLQQWRLTDSPTGQIQPMPDTSRLTPFPLCLSMGATLNLGLRRVRAAPTTLILADCSQQAQAWTVANVSDTQLLPSTGELRISLCTAPACALRSILLRLPATNGSTDWHHKLPADRAQLNCAGCLAETPPRMQPCLTWRLASVSHPPCTVSLGVLLIRPAHMMPACRPARHDCLEAAGDRASGNTIHAEIATAKPACCRPRCAPSSETVRP